MTSSEIEAAIAENVDPWAQSTCHAPVKRAKHPPLTDLLCAIHLSRFSGAQQFAQGVTAIKVPDAELRDRIEPSLSLALQYFCEALSLNISTIECLNFENHSVQKARYSSESKARQELDNALSIGKSVIAIVSDLADLSDAGKMLLKRSHEWPDFGQNTVIELLRATHSATAELAETELRQRLPSDDILRAMPWAIVNYAFAASTTLEVADRLASAILPTSINSGKTLDDVKGLPNVVTELRHLVADINLWRKGAVAWADVTSSYLLHGPPGTGKTMLAEALAGSADATLIATSYADNQAAGHMSDYLRSLARKVERAIAEAPSVFFIDELDSYRQRTGRSNHNDRYMHSVVNGLLTQLTKLNEADGVVVVGATNHPEMIDPAIVRAGRFDCKIPIKHPSKRGVGELLAALLGLPETELEHLTRRLVGLSGADIAAVARNAKGFARRCSQQLSIAHLQSAVDQQFPELDRDALFRKSVHEAGHAVVAHVLEMPSADRVYIAHDGGGYDAKTPPLVTPEGALYELSVLLAGRAAEEVVTGDISSGAGGDRYSDLFRATDLAIGLEQKFGFGTSLIYAGVPAKKRYRMPQRIQARVDERLTSAYELAADLIVEHRDLVETVAAALVEHRELDRTALLSILTANLPSTTQTNRESAQ